jgi:enoyl-CoA hydratase
MLIEARDLDGGVRILTLARPPANAIDASLLAALGEAADAAAAEERVRAVVVTGSGRFFSAGLDLKAMAAGGAGAMAGFGFADGIFKIWTLPKPTVAMVNGHAMAGGCILALACDFRVTCTGPHRIGLNETAVGLAFPTGAFEIAHLALTNRDARRALLEAEAHGAEEACRLGLVDEVVAPEQLEATCLAKARKLGAYAAPAYALNKQGLQRQAVERVRNEPPALRAAIQQAWTSEETLRAFAARLAAVSKREGS